MESTIQIVTELRNFLASLPGKNVKFSEVGSFFRSDNIYISDVDATFHANSKYPQPKLMEQTLKDIVSNLSNDSRVKILGLKAGVNMSLLPPWELVGSRMSTYTPKSKECQDDVCCFKLEDMIAWIKKTKQYIPELSNKIQTKSSYSLQDLADIDTMVWKRAELIWTPEEILAGKKNIITDKGMESVSLVDMLVPHAKYPILNMLYKTSIEKDGQTIPLVLKVEVGIWSTYKNPTLSTRQGMSSVGKPVKYYLQDWYAILKDMRRRIQASRKEAFSREMVNVQRASSILSLIESYELANARYYLKQDVQEFGRWLENNGDLRGRTSTLPEMVELLKSDVRDGSKKMVLKYLDNVGRSKDHDNMDFYTMLLISLEADTHFHTSTLIGEDKGVLCPLVVQNRIENIKSMAVKSGLRYTFLRAYIKAVLENPRSVLYAIYATTVNNGRIYQDFFYNEMRDEGVGYRKAKTKVTNKLTGKVEFKHEIIDLKRVQALVLGLDLIY